MLWLKRNLFLAVGVLVAVGLMVLAVLYLLHQIEREKSYDEALAQLSAELQRLVEISPSPSQANIDIAKQDTQRLRNFMVEVNKLLVAAPYTKMDDQQFRSFLENSVSGLNREATNAAVTIPTKYQFTFGAQLTKLKYAPNSIEPLYRQMIEIKALCTYAFQSKIHSLEGLKRAPVSTDDTASAGDYLDRRMSTNEFGVVVPYEITFRSFSAELASMINALSRSPEFVLIKNIQVQTADVGGALAMNTPAPSAAPPAPPPAGATSGSKPRPGAPAVKLVPKTILDEKPLRVTMQIDILRPLKPAK